MRNIKIVLLSFLLFCIPQSWSMDEMMKRVTIGVAGMMKSKTGIT